MTVWDGSVKARSGGTIGIFRKSVRYKGMDLRDTLEVELMKFGDQLDMMIVENRFQVSSLFEA